MTLTDDDLKRLKAKMENGVNMEQSVLVTDPDSVLALLARLEAAERCLGAVGELTEATAEFKAWRKAARK